ncbi:MAG: DUF357 domain-containing protein [Nanopusillaceae archaeon]
MNINNEIIEITSREIEKLKIVFEKIKFFDFELKTFIEAYWKDCLYFYNKKDYIKSFELVNYIWGILDCMANKNMIYIPEDIRKWFKI